MAEPQADAEATIEYVHIMDQSNFITQKIKRKYPNIPPGFNNVLRDGILVVGDVNHPLTKELLLESGILVSSNKL